MQPGDRVEREDLVQLEKLHTALALGLINGLGEHFEEVADLLGAHDVRGAILLLDGPEIVLIHKLTG